MSRQKFIFNLVRCFPQSSGIFSQSVRGLSVVQSVRLRSLMNERSTVRTMHQNVASFEGASALARSFSTGANDGEMNFSEFQEYINSKFALLIDVREPQELKDDGRIQGTVNIPLGRLESELSIGPEKLAKKYHLSTYTVPDGANFVFFCKAGVRAAKAAEIARKHGFKHARYYKGSFLDWKERGGDIVKDETK